MLLGLLRNVGEFNWVLKKIVTLLDGLFRSSMIDWNFKLT
jgi:hypothetical protein